MEKKIPTYRIIVNPDDEKTGVYAVSLVDEPAIEVDWIKLSKQVIDFEFSVGKDKQMLFGPLLIPGKLIFRRDEKGNEYNIVFDEETIQTIADKYNENKLNDVFNFQHSDKKVEAALLQNWITGEIDKSQEYGFTLPKGTWFGGVKVKDENFWMTEVKTGKVKGFSVEIMAGTELVEMSKVKCTFAKRLSLKSVMAVRECLGCPPNGDGTTTKGEPDKRCSGGDKKTTAPKAPKATIGKNISEVEGTILFEPEKGKSFGDGSQKYIGFEIDVEPVSKASSTLFGTERVVGITEKPIIEIKKDGLVERGNGSIDKIEPLSDGDRSKILNVIKDTHNKVKTSGKLNGGIAGVKDPARIHYYRESDKTIHTWSQKDVVNISGKSVTVWTQQNVVDAKQWNIKPGVSVSDAMP